MTKIGLFAYGEMGEATFKSLILRFNLNWIILPLPEKQTLTEKRTETLAKSKKIKLIYSPTFKDIENLIRKNTPNIIVVSSFDKVLPNEILKYSKFINIHLGDLPKMRGRATVNWAIICNMKRTVLTIHEISNNLDSGDIYYKFPIKITKSDSVGNVYEKIKIKIENSLVDVVNEILKGKKGLPQRGKPTYYCTRVPNDGLIDFNQNSIDVFNFIRALTKPYPGSFTFFNGKKMIVWDSKIPINKKNYLGRIPGRVVGITNEGIEVLTKDSSIIIGNVNYNNNEEKSSKIIKSVKVTLGIDFVSVYEKLMKENES